MKLTAKEDLVVEVLIARHRLGETLWTFHEKHQPTLNSLSGLGLVSFTHGNVENTVRAWLTDKGMKWFMPKPYDSPALKKNQAMLDRIRRSAQAIIDDAERVL